MDFTKDTYTTTVNVTEKARKLLKVFSEHIKNKFNRTSKPSYSLCIEQVLTDYLNKEGVEYNLDEIE